MFRDEATGYYYYKDPKDGKNILVDSNEELTFTSTDGHTVNIPAGKMTLSSGGVSFGSYAHAEGDRSMAFGRVSGAYDKNSTAVGLYANAYGEGGMAIGHNATVGAEVEVEKLDEGHYASNLKLDGEGNGIRSLNENGTPTQGGIAIGSYAHAEGDRAISVGRASGAYGKNSTAFGLYANALGEGALAIGHGSVTGAGVVISRTDPTDTESHVTDLADLDEDGNPKLLTGVRGGIAIGSYSHAEGDRAISIGRVAGAYDKNSTAVGLYANALGEGALAIGHNASAGAEVIVSSPAEDVHTSVVKLDGGTSGNPIATGGIGGIAIGSYAHATGNRAVSIGRASGAYGENSTAMGIFSNALGRGSIAFGHGSSTGVVAEVEPSGAPGTAEWADGFWTTKLTTDSTGNPVSNENDGGIAIGSYAHTEGTRALAVGRVSGAYGTNSSVFGLRSNAYGEGSMAFGHGVTAGNKNDKYAAQIPALHNDPTIEYDLDGKDPVPEHVVNPNNVVGAIALGSYAEATGRGSLSVGRYSMAKSAYSTTLGIRASVLESAENAIAIGREAQVGAINEGRVYGGLNSIAMGTLTNVKGQNSIAIGTADMLNAAGTEIVAPGERKATTITGDSSVAIGKYDTITGNNSIAIGSENVVKGDGSGAIGDPNTVNGNSSYILGNNSSIGSISTEASTGGDTGNGSGEGNESGAGDGTGSTSGESSTSADISINNAFITGNNSSVLSEGGLIYGSNATITENAGNGLALGNGTTVSVPGAVALGSTTVAQRAANNGGDANNTGYDPSTRTNYAGADKDTATWVSTLGAVSVGGAEGDTDKAGYWYCCNRYPPDYRRSGRYG